MITIIHGNDLEKSREMLTNIKKQSQSMEIRDLDGRRINQTELIQAVESSSLFKSTVMVVIENLFTGLGRKTKQAEEYVKIINGVSPETEIILWESKILTLSQTKLFSQNVKFLEYKLPVIIFQFLDGLKPGKRSDCLKLYNQLLIDYAPEQLFFMISKRIRQLLILKNNETIKGITSWQYGKLTSQAKLFTMEQLQHMLMTLRNIDWSIKSGKTPLLYDKHISLWLCSI